MANLDSLSFALLIPFSICFLLVFLVCCFAEEIKEMCRMPSQLPAYYLTARTDGGNYDVIPNGRRRSRRHRSRSRSSGRHRQNDQRQTSNAEEARVLILNEERRSRNDSENSSESNVNNIYTQRNSGLILCPQTIVSNGSYIPISQTSLATNCIPAPHNITRSRGGVLGSIVRCNDVMTPRSPGVSINRNISVPGSLSEQRFNCDNTSRSFRNLPSVIPLGLPSDKKV